MDGLSIAASLHELAPVVEGSLVRTINQPAVDQFVLRLFGQEDVLLVVDLGAAAVYRTQEPPQNPRTPSPLVMLLRKHLRGGRIRTVQQAGWDRVVTWEIARMEGSEVRSYALIAELLGGRGNLHLVEGGRVIRSARNDRRNQPGEPFAALPPQEKQDPQGVTPELLARWTREEDSRRALVRHVDGLGHPTAMDLAAGDLGDDPPLTLCLRIRALCQAVASPLPHLTLDDHRATFYRPPVPASPMTSYQQALAHAYGERRDGHVAPPADDTLRGLRKAVRAKERTLQKLEETLDQTNQADAWKAEADLLMTYAWTIPPAQREVTLVDPTTERPVTIGLDPSLSARENAQRLYGRAKRARRGRIRIEERLVQVQQDLVLLASAMAAHARGDAVPEQALVLIPGRSKSRARQTHAQPFRRFEADGFTIWVGKSARQNDALLRAAAPNDLWLHVRDYAGSHVVVRTRRSQETPDSVLEAAARLAAQHSKASGNSRADVVVARVKHVRKPKGAPAGLANVTVSDTLTVDLRKGGR